jgi:imidazolonepropionase-like amidohydrolase
MILKLALFLTAISCLTLVEAQTIAISADRLIDGKSDKELLNPTIIIYNGKIIGINFENKIPDSATVISLKGYTLLPGMIDAHTHVLVDGFEFEPDLYGNTDAYRSIRATSYLQTMLMNGFTSIRDLCTEGAAYSDVDLSRAVTNGLIDGPRIFPATKGIAATGRYFPAPSEQKWQLQLPSGAQYVTGIDECTKAVREQISNGAKWIKVFVDFSPRSGFPALNLDELKAIVKEARKYSVFVAAHATTKEGIEMAINAGVRSIEHGNGVYADKFGFTDELMQRAITNNIFWVPTVLGMEERGWPSMGVMYAALNKAQAKGLKIAMGTDIGSCAWTNYQAKEVELYVTKAGFKPLDAIKSATSVAAELLNIETELGQININYRADIIAVKGNPLIDITLLQQVMFVMKDGKVYKKP